MGIVIAQGPPSNTVSRKQAEAAIKRNPNIPQGADEIEVFDVAGQWYAAVHVAAPPPFAGGGPADADEGAPGPKSVGPDDAEPSEGPEDGDEDGDEGKPPFGKEKGEGEEGEGHEKAEGAILHKLVDAVDKILLALGIPDDMAAGNSPVPGADGPPAPPGPPGPAGPKGPDQTVEHTKALKPGEVPPGGTPIGAPAFSHIHPHPWEKLVGVVATFETEERIPEQKTLASVDHELQELCHGTGFKVKQITESRDLATGHRVARALISAY